jgi:hypothetical protein
MDRYPILQSGFISLTEDGLIKPRTHDDIVLDDILSKDFRVPTNKNFYSIEVVKLFGHWTAEHNSITNFEIRERVIKLALKYFGNSFYKWVITQNKSNNLTELHKQFIYDTLNYLSGDNRSLEAVQWVPLVDINFYFTGDKLNVDKYFGTQAGSLPSSIVDIIQRWTSKPNGYEDLLITLFTIFGNRPKILNVAEKKS